ncbi:copper transporter 6-like [Malania oleifera]|uniref:copper transporter 6-like n=1 Tax=Malania oleifera TaxID=397392 RepID=UPI0025ADE0CD|nr:copper transporter 6-like [Malania oleifera]
MAFMANDGHGHMHGMNNTAAMDHPMKHHMMMHMTFFWGKNAEILFSGWPGSRAGMYSLALIFVFALAFLVEWLSHCRLIKPGSEDAASGILQTAIHAVRVALAYMVMLAVMSFNVGVFLVAVGGHAVGFLLFGSRVFRRTPEQPHLQKQAGSDFGPLSC